MGLMSIDMVRDTTMQRVAGALDVSNQLKAAELAGTSGAAVYDAFYAASITKENIDSMFVSWWKGAYRVDYTRTQLLQRWFDLLADDKTFGVKFYKFDVSQSTAGERIDDAVGLQCAPSTNAVKGADDYCKEKAFWTVEINYEIDANGEIEVKAVDKVDVSFSRDGSAGMVGVAQKTGWCQYVDDGTYIIQRYRACRKNGFYPLPEGVSPVDNGVRSFVVHAKYMAGFGTDGKLTSATGLAPYNYTASHNSQIAEWRKRGANYAGISICDINFRLLMFQLKYAMKGNSGTLEGCSGYDVRYTAAVSETGVERILLTTAQAANLLVGSWIILGTNASSDRNAATSYSVCKNKQIKSIREVSLDGATYAAVNIDNGGVTFDTTAGTTQIITNPWGSGSCDDVLGVDGSPTNCTNGKEPFIIQGLESQTGAYAVVADVIGVNTVADSASTWTPNVCRKAAKISTSATADYVASDKPIKVATSDCNKWLYIGDISHCDKLPEVPAAGVFGGSAGSSNGYRAAVSVPSSPGSFEWLAWANLGDYGHCGLLCAGLDFSLGVASWSLAAGASGSGANRGEWAG